MWFFFFFFFLFRCFRVTTHEGQVSYQGCSLLKRRVFLRDFRSFYSISNAPAGAVPPQGETVVRQRRRTVTALATYRNETIQALSTPRPQTPSPRRHRIPGSSQGIIVCLPPSCQEERRRRAPCALPCVEPSRWNVRNAFGKGRSKDTVNRCFCRRRHQRREPFHPNPSMQPIKCPFL